MTSIYLPRKSSEQGASLIMLVSIIGLAFIMTVAVFLVAASNGQDTARIASAKVDIATREDALMREILQQTATGMLPGTNGVTGANVNWNTIMTTAATNLLATSYVDPAELTALPGLAGVIPDNTGDTGGALLGIFQGYNNTEVPFGGTTGVANVVPAPTPSVLPPLMNWSGNATLSAANASITPQEFFLGSQYTGLSAAVTKVSLSNRWGQLIYPNIRFGYKQPGNLFIARRVWWRIPVLFQTTQLTQAGVARFPGALANYVLSVYEIPSQLPISGNANLQIGSDSSGTAWGNTITIAGSVSGNRIVLTGGTYSGVSSRQAVTVSTPTTVNGVAYSNSNFDQAGTREQSALTQTPGVAAPVSVAGNDGKVLLVPVLPGNDFYMTAASAPTHWDLYARPYYRCRIRVLISNTDSTIIYPSATSVTNTAAGKITVTIVTSPDTTNSPDQIVGFPDSAGTTQTFTQTSLAAPTLPSYMNYTSANTASGDHNILIIDVNSMVTSLAALYGSSAPQLYSVYVGSNPSTEPNTAQTTSDPNIGITDTNDLSTFTNGFSIVTNQPLYLIDAFNQGATTVPTSVYAPQVRYGISAATLQVNLTGQVAVVSAPGATVYPLSFKSGNGTAISSGNTTVALSEVTDPKLLPPITAVNLLFTIEKERTN